jgi:hypothetical protein
MKPIDPPPRTIIARCSACPRLIAENVRSWEWESFARREPRPARERLSPIGVINAGATKVMEANNASDFAKV